MAFTRAMSSRNEAHAVRLATIYAILHQSPSIRIQHLEAALAVVDYSTRSLRRIFGSQIGGRTADTILHHLKQAAPAGLTRNDVINLFGRNKKSNEIAQALQILEQFSLAYMQEEATAGRTAQRWFFRTPIKADAKAA